MVIKLLLYHSNQFSRDRWELTLNELHALMLTDTINITPFIMNVRINCFFCWKLLGIVNIILIADPLWHVTRYSWAAFLKRGESFEALGEKVWFDLTSFYSRYLDISFLEYFQLSHYSCFLLFCILGLKTLMAYQGTKRERMEVGHNVRLTSAARDMLGMAIVVDFSWVKDISLSGCFFCYSAESIQSMGMEFDGI